VCRDYAEEKAATGDYFILNQFANPDNYQAHIKSTGPEIWRDTEGKITHFVVQWVQQGRLWGVPCFLKRKTPAFKLLAVSPQRDLPYQEYVAGQQPICP